MPPTENNFFREILDGISDEVPISVDPDLTLQREGVFNVAKAYIAETLAPNVDKHLGEHSSARIVGYDAGYLQKDGETWFGTLARWLDRGCDIEYLLINPHIEPGVKSKLESLAAGRKGRFVVRTVTDTPPVDPRDKAVIEKWRTYHFCLFANPRQLWVEKNHPIGEYNAYDCSYVPPNVAEELADYRILNSQFSRLYSKYGVQVVP